MPKIEADSLAQHRANREKALIDAARRLLLADGVAAVTPSKVAAQVGLARSAVYTYIHSGRHLLVRLLDDDFTGWAEQIHAVVRAAGPDPDARLHAYARGTLQLAAAGTYRVVTTLPGGQLDEQLRTRVDELLNEVTAPLHAALVERGDTDPDTTAALVQAAVDAAVRLIETGRAVDPVVDRTLRFLRGAIAH